MTIAEKENSVFKSLCTSYGVNMGGISLKFGQNFTL
jgi:hypothetical protein